MLRRGFTVVEIIITITIMGILLTLAVVNLTASQVNGRDAERKGDIEALSTNLETFYRNGTDASPTVGRYPSTAITASESALRAALRGVIVAADGSEVEPLVGFDEVARRAVAAGRKGDAKVEIGIGIATHCRSKAVGHQQIGFAEFDRRGICEDVLVSPCSIHVPYPLIACAAPVACRRGQAGATWSTNG